MTPLQLTGMVAFGAFSFVAGMVFLWVAAACLRWRESRDAKGRCFANAVQRHDMERGQ